MPASTACLSLPSVTFRCRFTARNPTARTRLQHFTAPKVSVHHGVTSACHIRLTRQRRRQVGGARPSEVRYSDDRFRSAARSGDPPAAALCARADARCDPRRRSRPELPDPGRRQAASVAARHRSAGLAVHDPAQSARQRGAPLGARGRQCRRRGHGAGADRPVQCVCRRCNCAISKRLSPGCRRSSAR